MNAAELVTRAMANLPDHPDIQSACCGALFVLTSLPACGKDMQDRLVSLGAAELIVKVRRPHCHTTTLLVEAPHQLTRCLKAHEILQRNQYDSESVAFVRRWLVQAMSSFGSETAVTATGCSAICGLALNHAENQSRLADAGAVSVAVTALERHVESAEVVMAAAEAIMALACHHQHNQALLALADRGACELLTEAGRRYGNHGPP